MIKAITNKISKNEIVLEDGERVEALLDRYHSERARHQRMKTIWQDCYRYALPRTDNQTSDIHADLYDATAQDSVEELAAALLGHVAPPWGDWFGFKGGTKIEKSLNGGRLNTLLADASKTLQDHLDRSNFSVALHQCFLDLVTVGTAALGVEGNYSGQGAALKFTPISMANIILAEGPNGMLERSYRSLSLSLEQARHRYKGSFDDESYSGLPSQKFEFLEVIEPTSTAYSHSVLDMNGTKPKLIKEEHLDDNPIIAFRWTKGPNDIYGRSPVMKTLPDIKTANKVVELILKNASIAATGIWQADDDGVLNPSNIELAPGVIIPKAVGSQGLKPLDMPGRIDVSELVLKDLRGRIRHALYTDRLSVPDAPNMTATEIIERANQSTLLLGAVFGRLQCELLYPLIKRCYALLAAAGLVPDLKIDGRTLTIDYRSPIATAQSRKDVSNILQWLNSAAQMGAGTLALIDTGKVTRHIGEKLGVPQELLPHDLEAILTSKLPKPDSEIEEGKNDKKF